MISITSLFYHESPARKMPPTDSGRFSICVNFVLLREGGFVNHPADPGGATNKGITLRVLQDWRGKSCSISDVSALTIPEAEAIYRAKYWTPILGDQLAPGLDLAVFDAAVNSGPSQAIRWLQRASNSTQDGVLGAGTLAAVQRQTPHLLATTVCDLRIKFLRTLSTWPTFGKGWERRINEVRAEVEKMNHV